ncbi:hypothetical protein Aeqsu_0721 [Aequorivita sublithincola DSM 14238]|uniref:DUF4394 domain-containing protein n=1 Tax=Aequorivita sublithincola (strain DSM 14238 / LMG 21431 / ACAM 643 / 9-3) TaxID=746697 RepID=I3YTB1_AEQSU|nr:hypothetical protein [Aequorivita sublithincola]AFL80229.1 hypothetical protein Aeqsu_0721 [Aequorivita sublithincola DSM 14238]
MKNFKTLFGFVFIASILFTNCSDDDTVTDDDPTNLPCANYNKELLTLTTAFDGNPNAVIDYNSFIINNLDPLLPNSQGSFTTTSNLSFELPTNGSIYNEASNLHGILVSRAGKYFTFNTSTGVGQESVVPSDIASPVLVGNLGYVIEVSNFGYGTSGVADQFKVRPFNITDGTLGAALPISAANTTFNNNSFFTVETMSMATDAVDKLFFLSGTNLVTVNKTSNIASQIDLYPSFSMLDYVRFFGLEYSESLGLIAIMDMASTNTRDLVKINPSTNTVVSLISIPADINNEFYSTTYSECKKTYYLTTLQNGSSPTKTLYFEFNLTTNTINNSQIIADYVFGIDLIPG